MRRTFALDDAGHTQCRRNDLISSMGVLRLHAANRNALLVHIPRNAVLDSLDPDEADWWRLQRRIQRGAPAEPGQDATPAELRRHERQVAEYNALLAARAALEAKHPHLATYRGEAGPERPDMRAEVTARIAPVVRAWINHRVAQRLTKALTVGNKTIAASNDATVMLLLSERDTADNGGTHNNIDLPLGDGYTRLNDAAQVTGLLAAEYAQRESAYQWGFARQRDVDEATTPEDLCAILGAHEE